MNKKNAYLCLLLTPILVMVLVSAFACKKSSQATFPTMFSTPTPTPGGTSTSSSGPCTFISQWKGASVTLNNPHGIAVDYQDNIYVSSYGNKYVQVFKSTGAVVTSWTVPYFPEGIGVDNAINVYVADQNGNQVYKYTKDGSSIKSLSVASVGVTCGWYATPDATSTPSTGVTTYLTGTWNYEGPMGVALDGSGNLYNTSFWDLYSDPCGNDYEARLWKYTNGSGMWNTLWRSVVVGTSNPVYATVNYAGTYAYVADSSANHVYCINTSLMSSPLTYVARVPNVDSTAGGSGDTQFNAPHGVAVDSNGYVFVADTHNNRIKVYDSTLTTLLAKIGKTDSSGNPIAGTGVGEFNNPWAVAVDNEDNLYVSDTINNRIQKFSPYH
jgi:hypothetical protein